MEEEVNDRKWLDNDRQNSENEYNEFASRNIRSNRDYTKWMPDRLKHLIGMKR